MTDIAVAHDEMRSLMFAIAYRMLGSVSEAEDVVQDAFLRIHEKTAGGVVLESRDAYATTVTTRLAIDALRSARRRRELYFGTWLPEPLLDDDADPAHQVVRDESVSSAFLVVLERLTPVERAVFLLHEVFGLEYAEIADVVGKTQVNCRRVFSRATRRLQEGARFEPDPQRSEVLASKFLDALQGEDLDGLERLLAEDVVFYADGGGKAPAIKTPLEGAVAVARFLVGLARQGRLHHVQITPTSVAGYPAYRVLGPDASMLGLLVLHTRAGVVTCLRNQINPDKLRHLGTVGDLNAVLGLTVSSS